MTAALLLITFIIIVLLLYLKRITVMIALPLLAIVFALIAAVPSGYFLEIILDEGSARLVPAILATIFGGMLAALIRNQGIAESMIRYAAEFSGDHPLTLALVLMFATAMLFVSVSGLSAAIMVGTIVLPAMLSIGIPPVTAGVIMLIGLAAGSMLNIANWQLYMSVLQLSKSSVRDFMVLMASLLVLTGIAFCAWSLRKSQLHRFFAMAAPPVKSYLPYRRLALLSPLIPLLMVLIFDWPIVPSFVVALMYTVLATNADGEYAIYPLAILLANILAAKMLASRLFEMHLIEDQDIWRAAVNGMLLTIPYLIWLAGSIWRAYRNEKPMRILAALTSLLPLFMIHLIDIDIKMSFIAGLLLALAVTTKATAIQRLTKSILESFHQVAPLLAVIIGIGMFWSAVSHPKIVAAIDSMLHGAAVAGPVAFVVVSALAAPLALYRSPLNIWGIGSAVAVLLLATGLVKPQAIMAALVSIGMMQAVCDSTNAHHDWVATHVNAANWDLTKKALPFMFPLTLAGLIVAALHFF